MIGLYEFNNPFLKIIISIWNKFYCNVYSFFSDESLQNKFDLNDKDFMSRAQTNMHAESLLDKYGNNILRLAYSYLKNMSDAEEVLQETLIQFIKTRPYLETTTHEKAWLLRVAINISKNKIQYNKIRTTDELNEDLIGEEKEDLAFVWDAVKKLPVKYREVIHLFYHEDYSTAQIAKILNKNETTIRSLLHRGRAKLKEVLKEGYDFEE